MTVVRFVAIFLWCCLAVGCSSEDSGSVQTSSSDDSADESGEADLPAEFSAEDAQELYRVWFEAQYWYLNETLRTGIPDPSNSSAVVDAMDPALLGRPAHELGSHFHDCSVPDWLGVFEMGVTELEFRLDSVDAEQLREGVWLVTTNPLTRMVAGEEMTDWVDGRAKTVLVTKDGVGPIVGNRFRGCEAWPRSELGHSLANDAADHLGVDRLRTCEELLDEELMPEAREGCFYESTPVVAAIDQYSCSEPFGASSYDIPAVGGVGYWLGVDDLGWMLVVEPGGEQAHPGYESCFPDDGDRPLTGLGG